MSVLALVDGTGVVIGLVVVAVLALVARRRLLARRGATFDCSVRFRAAAGPSPTTWTWGVACYAGERVDWYRALSYSLRPRLSFARAALHVRQRRRLRPGEAVALRPAGIVVTCEIDGQPVELAISEEALTGLLAWLEAAPPGQGIATAP